MHRSRLLIVLSVLILHACGGAAPSPVPQPPAGTAVSAPYDVIIEGNLAIDEFDLVQA